MCCQANTCTHENMYYRNTLKYHEDTKITHLYLKTYIQIQLYKKSIDNDP